MFAGEKLNKLKTSTAILAMVLLAVLVVNLTAASTAIPKSTGASISFTAEPPNAISPINTNPSPTSIPTTAPSTVDNSKMQPVTTDEVEKLKEQIPKNLQEAESIMPPIRTRYLMYTNNGAHIMWGSLGNGRFIGTDNNGKHCWGIYGQGIFAGFYDGQFFWGKYSNGAWKAEYLFGLRYSQGNYVLFPQVTPTLTTTEP